jgi:hypothetical protein
MRIASSFNVPWGRCDSAIARPRSARIPSLFGASEDLKVLLATLFGVPSPSSASASDPEAVQHDSSAPNPPTSTSFLSSPPRRGGCCYGAYHGRGGGCCCRRSLPRGGDLCFPETGCGGLLLVGHAAAVAAGGGEDSAPRRFRRRSLPGGRPRFFGIELDGRKEH